jgi:hypothetical protein
LELSKAQVFYGVSYLIFQLHSCFIIFIFKQNPRGS